MIKIIKNIKDKIDENGPLEVPIDNLNDGIWGKSNILHSLGVLFLCVIFYIVYFILNLFMLFASVLYDIEIVYNYFYKLIDKNWYNKSIIKALNKHAKLNSLNLYLYDCINAKHVLIDDKDYKQFIKRFILQYRKIYDTYYHRDEEGYLMDHTGTYRRRSLGDIYRVTKTYFPNVTIVDVTKELIKLLENGEIYGSYCTTIHKYVYHDDSNVYKVNDAVEWFNNGKWSDVVKALKDE